MLLLRPCTPSTTQRIICHLVSTQSFRTPALFIEVKHGLTGFNQTHLLPQWSRSKEETAPSRLTESLASSEGSSAVRELHVFVNTALEACLKLGVPAIVTTARAPVKVMNQPRGLCTYVHVATHDERNKTSSVQSLMSGFAETFTTIEIREAFGRSRGFDVQGWAERGGCVSAHTPRYASDSA